MPSWYWTSASCRGTSHIRSGTRKQDAVTSFVCGPDSSIFVAVVSDGAGSASHGGEGASIVCRTISSSIKASFLRDKAFPDDAIVWLWLDDVRDRIGLAAKKRDLQKRDFAATMVCLITDGFQTIVAHVGDGSAVARRTESQEWEALSWPENGQYASTTYFVTDDPVANLRLSRHDYEIDALAVFSDGIERLALEFAANRPFSPFFKNLIVPVEKINVPGLNVPLSQKLKSYLDSDPINQRTDDDKTLLLSVRR
jgi:hypothetical protein